MSDITMTKYDAARWMATLAASEGIPIRLKICCLTSASVIGSTVARSSI